MRAELERRALPPLKSRAEMADVLQKCVYGYLPQIACSWSAAEPVFVERRYACGAVAHSFTELTVTGKGKSHTFRVDRLLHADGKKRPLVIYMNFHPMVASPYFPTEEMSEYEADFLVFCYKDVTSDDGDFENGIAPLLLHADAPCGKIADPKEAFLDGRIGYFMIESKHFMSRHSWRRYMEFIERHRKERV